MTTTTSPYLTGGGGTSFEHCVQALALIDLASGSFMRVFDTCQVQVVRFQARVLGYHTDDLLLGGVDNEDDRPRRVLCQIKHSIRCTEHDGEWIKSVKGFWDDYSNADLFDPERDALELSVACVKDADKPLVTALNRIRQDNTACFSQKGEKKLQAIKSIIEDCADRHISDEEFFAFLKRLYIVEYGELDSWDSASKVQRIRQSPELWEEALLLAHNGDSKGARYSISSLPESFRVPARFNISNTSMTTLWNHSRRLMEDIHDTVGSFHAERTEELNELDASLSSKGVVFVEGDSGVGKSALVKNCLNRNNETTIVWLRAEDLKHESLEECAKMLNLEAGLRNIVAQLSLVESVVVVVDSLERLLQGSGVVCLQELIRGCISNGFCFIGILRSTAFDLLQYRIDLYKTELKRIDVSPLSEDGLEQLCNVEPTLAPLLEGKWGVKAFRNPFTLEMLRRVTGDKSAPTSIDNPRVLREHLWRNGVMRMADGPYEAAVSRGKTFEHICVTRASTIEYVVDCQAYDTGVIRELQESGLLRMDEHDLYVVTHDRLEDLGVFHYLDGLYNSMRTNRSRKDFFAAIERGPGLSVAFRAWLKELIDTDEQSIDFVKGCLLDDMLSKQIRRSCLVAIIDAGRLDSLLVSLCDALLDEPELFEEIASAVRLSAVDCYPVLGPAEELLTIPRAPLVFIPKGKSWKEFFAFVNVNYARLDKSSLSACVKMLTDWSVIRSPHLKHVLGMREAGLLALALLKDGYGRVSSNWYTTSLATVATSCYPAISEEYNAALDESRTEGNCVPRIARELREDAVLGMGAASMANDDPELLARLTKAVFYVDRDNKRDGSFFESDEGKFGLSSIARDYSFAHGRRPPFHPLFLYSPKIAVQLCVEICNHIGETIESEKNNKWNCHDATTLELLLYERTTLHVLFSTDLWVAYRGMGCMPPAIQSMLMSLENYLIGLAEDGGADSLQELLESFSYIMEQGRTALTLGVLASLGNGFPELLGSRCIPLLSMPQLYFADINRQSEEGLVAAPWPYEYADRMAYEVDRVKSNAFPWRDKSLRELCISLQLSHDTRHEVFRAIDRMDDDPLIVQKLKSRIDTRSFSAEVNRDSHATALSSRSIEHDERLVRQHKQFVESSGLYSWSRSMLDTSALDKDLSQMFAVAQGLSQCDEQNSISAVYLFCATVVRLGSGYRSEDDLYGWCAKRLLDACENALDGGDDIRAVEIAFASLEDCFRSLPLLAQGAVSSMCSRARKLIEQAFLSSYASIAKPTAEGVSRYLWPIDHSFAASLLVARECHHALSDKDAIEAGVRFDTDSRTVLLLACPNNGDGKEFPRFMGYARDALAAEEYIRQCRTTHKLRPSHIENEAGQNGPAKIVAQHLYCGKNIDAYASMLIDGIRRAPEHIQSILVHLSAICRQHDDMQFQWNVVEALRPSLVAMAKERPDDDRSDWASLIGNVLYRDADWQKADYENRDIRYGKRQIVGIAKNAASNIIVFESLARLMYEFPDVFSIDCALILAQVDYSRISQVFERSADAEYCLVAFLRTFVLGQKNNEITREQYDACLLVLDAAIEHGSRQAYFVRESFVHRRWSFSLC